MNPITATSHRCGPGPVVAREELVGEVAGAVVGVATGAAVVGVATGAAVVGVGAAPGGASRSPATPWPPKAPWR